MACPELFTSACYWAKNPQFPPTWKRTVFFYYPFWSASLPLDKTVLKSFLCPQAMIKERYLSPSRPLPRSSIPINCCKRRHIFYKKCFFRKRHFLWESKPQKDRPATSTWCFPSQYLMIINYPSIHPVESPSLLPQRRVFSMASFLYYSWLIKLPFQKAGSTSLRGKFQTALLTAGEVLCWTNQDIFSEWRRSNHSWTGWHIIN